jgi:hypothetical protein
MPVEESGNLLILVAAMERELGNWRLRPANTGRSSPSGRNTCEKNGLDPENQLSTDDFRRPPGPQRQPLHQGHRRPWAPTPNGPRPRQARRGRRVRKAKDGRANGRPWRSTEGPLQARLRQARHLEPEIQPRLGPDPRPETSSRPRSADRARLLPQATSTNSACPSTTAPTTPSSTGQIWTATLADKSPDQFDAFLAHRRNGSTRAPPASPSPTGTTPKPASRSAFRPAP